MSLPCRHCLRFSANKKTNPDPSSVYRDFSRRDLFLARPKEKKSNRLSLVQSANPKEPCKRSFPTLHVAASPNTNGTPTSFDQALFYAPLKLPSQWFETEGYSCNHGEFSAPLFVTCCKGSVDHVGCAKTIEQCSHEARTRVSRGHICRIPLL